MNYNHTIVEIAPRQYVLARQNIASEIWSCGDVRSRSCLSVALIAAKNRLATIYPAVECATRALFAMYPEDEVAGNISFASAVDIRTPKHDLPVVVYVASSDRPLFRGGALPILKL